MNKLSVGFAEVQITPPLGIYITGYYQDRYADGILDDLYMQAVAFSDGEKKSVLVTVDNIGIYRKDIDILRAAAAKATGLPETAIFITCSHTHTGPKVIKEEKHPFDAEYFAFFSNRLNDVINLALADLKPAKIGYSVGNAPRISFIRRFRMKDGRVRTNPGVNNPDIVAPIGDVDERVSVIRIDREGAETVVVVNFGVHPDVVGGCKISADFPGFVRRTVCAAIDNVKCVFINGAQGDLNHVNVFPRPGEGNGMFHDFDDVDRGYPHSRHMGNVIAAGVLQVYEKVKYIDTETIDFAEVPVKVPANLPDPADLPLAHKYVELHTAGKDEEIPYKGMELTTEVARAARMVRLEHGPDSFVIPVTAMRIGEIVFVGFAGEPFGDIGKGVKDNPNYELVIPCALTNGSEGYFPVMNAYVEGGYESASSEFKVGVAEILIEEGNALANSIR